jgi:hypothetical protein
VAQTDDLNGQGIKALVTAHATASGDVITDSKVTGRQDLTVSCTGSDCGAVAAQVGTTFPCAIAITFTASKQ